MRSTLALASILFFCSGALGLSYELVWIRKAGLVVGASHIAIATVLTSFFVGLAFGSRIVGRYLRSKHRSPLLLYGLFELGIGAFALAFPLLFDLVESAYGALYPIVADSTVLLFGTRFALLFLLFLPPTFLMGGTLPLLLDGLVTRDDTIGAKASLLYGINVFGAVAGVVVTAYWAIPALGWNGTSVVAGCGNLALGTVAALAFLRHSPPNAVAAPESPLGILGGVAFGSGMLAIGFQVGWARYFSLLEVGSVWTTASLLAVFLAALATGSLIVAALLRYGIAPVTVLATALALVPALAMHTMWCWDWVDFSPQIAALATEQGGWRALESLEVQPKSALLSERLDMILTSPLLKVGLVVFLPAMLLGVGLPALIATATRASTELRSTSGRLAFWSTLGSSAGAFATGYLLLPLTGLHGTWIILGTGALLLALVVQVKFAPTNVPGWIASAAGGIAVVAFAASEDLTTSTITKLGLARRTVNRFAPKPDQQQPRLVEVVEGPLTTSFVLNKDGKTQLCSGFVSMATIHEEGIPGQVVQGHLPVLFYPGKKLPSHCLGVCLGSGQSFGALLAYPIDSLDVVDISRSIVDLTRRRFGAYNHDLGRDPRVTFHLDDGRHFIQRAHAGSYDVISMEPPPPRADGVHTLYSVEFYRAVRRALAPGGVFMQWLPLYRVTPNDARAILATQVSVFPQSFVVRQGNEDFMVLSYPRRPTFDLRAIIERCKTLAKERNLAGKRWSPRCRFDIATFQAVVPLLIAGPDALAKLDAPVLTDDRQHLGYGLGDSWLHLRYQGRFLSRITFAALPKSSMLSLADYLDPPFHASAPNAEHERAASLDFFNVADPGEVLRLRVRLTGLFKKPVAANAALRLAELHDDELDKARAFSELHRALELEPGMHEPAQIRIANKLVLNHFAVYATQIHAAVQNLERTFGDRPVVTAMRAQLDALQQREKLRHNRYLLR